MSILDAKSFLVIDELGIDPLRDKSHDAVNSIPVYTWYTVRPEESNNAPLLSYNVYSNPGYWRYIMMYNGILDMFALTEGMRLKIPSQQLLVSVLNNILISTEVKTFRI